jgi:hypothetical protein
MKPTLQDPDGCLQIEAANALIFEADAGVSRFEKSRRYDRQSKKDDFLAVDVAEQRVRPIRRNLDSRNDSARDQSHPEIGAWHYRDRWRRQNLHDLFGRHEAKLAASTHDHRSYFCAHHSHRLRVRPKRPPEHQAAWRRTRRELRN